MPVDVAPPAFICYPLARFTPCALLSGQLSLPYSALILAVSLVIAPIESFPFSVTFRFPFALLPVKSSYCGAILSIFAMYDRRIKSSCQKMDGEIALCSC